MAIHCSLHHKTSYHYERPVHLGPQVIRLRPAPHNRTPILSYSLKIEPEGHFINWQQDPQGNYLARLLFPEPVKKFEICVDLVADMTSIDPFDFFLDEFATKVPFSYDAVQREELAPFLRNVLPHVKDGCCRPKLYKLVEECRPKKDEDTNNFLVRINQVLEKRIGYTIRMEPGVQDPEETLTKGTGSCRDTSWLLVQLLRRLGFAARFVSGYLIQLKPDIDALDGPSGAAQDFTDLHAWAEVFLPGAGWVGLDPTSGLMAGEGHIPLAATPDPPSAAPMSGSLMEAQEVETEFDFDMTVTRVHETARVTKPYSEKQWQDIDALGEEIESRLQAADVRLTMGGEPTFVSIDDMDGAEWDIDAMGPTKRGLADTLLHKMKDRFAAGGFLHHGQGKWYPGEQLPRWAFNCYWRRDGVPVWQDDSLIAVDDKDYGHNSEDSAAFTGLLAKKLQLGTDTILPGYEDTLYYLWREQRLPKNVDPHDSKLADKVERARIARVFDNQLDHQVGHMLPLAHDDSDDRWVSEPWHMRQPHLFLVPGDSPMGLRLPLGALPWAEKDPTRLTMPMDPTAPRQPLPAERITARGDGYGYDPQATPSASVVYQRSRDFADGEAGGNSGHSQDEGGSPLGAGEEATDAALRPRSEEAPYTALCVEAREGKLHVFLPPLKRLEAYLELVAAVEDTAAELEMPVQLEGYLPPRDPRINQFSVTPDPGVIEVNVHPTHNWSELKDVTTGLYEDARHTRLGTEKFRVDGTHTGTGGGNHIVVGGATPLDSPFLRRPDMLRSMVSFWHNHPSLSYLFSGGFIGPTSQAPRADEARADTVYEMEIAFSQLPKKEKAADCPPWLIDRVMRNLLIDLTGNTHRAEFCIDKLYSPSGSTGRLGLVELRGFEMPPHAEMSLAQQLLVRASIARFWDQPYEAELVRWGTGLHDRFLLPHFIREDFADVLDSFKSRGIHFDPAWFEPHLEFRFPEIGHISPSGVHLELRQAIEPWNVLGEEQSSTGTARYVDSSVERLQVFVSGLTDSRHVVTCNGRRVPLHPTARPGEFVAGVRYRAWSPPSALHPTIPVHAPLTFDLIDSWNDRSLGGCEYHVTHPGGRSHDDFPVNSYAAESRRKTRFVAFGHTPGKIVPPTEHRSREFPLTLDLQIPPVYS